MSLAALLAEASSRNTVLLASYRMATRRLVSRTLTGLAASAIEQRRKLGEELAALQDGLADQGVSLDYPDFPKDPLPEACADDTQVILAWFRDMEAAERDLYQALAVQPGLDGDLAARLSAWAQQARKRASVASDHLDLLSLG